MIDEARRMERQGIRAITTSCGFNAVFQRELADAVRVPVFTSSLMQVPLVQRMLGNQRTVGVITAKKAALTEKHLKGAGIEDRAAIYIQGLETCTEWNKIFSSPDEKIDIPTVANDLVRMAGSMTGKNRYRCIRIGMHRSAPVCRCDPPGDRPSGIRFCHADQLCLSGDKKNTRFGERSG